MTVVVDLGAFTHPRYPQDESTMRLIERFDPTHYYGFDPHPDLIPDAGARIETRPGLTLSLTREAAWTHDGTVAYDPRPDRPLAAAVGKGPLVVRCFDLARWIRGTRTDLPGTLVVKMDVEGAEYPLLEHLIAEHAAVMDVLLVEWHQPPVGPHDWEFRRSAILAQLPPWVEVSEW